MDALISKFYSLICPCFCLMSMDICSLLYERKVAGWAFPLVSLEFFVDVILWAALRTWILTQALTEMSTGNISWGVKAACARVYNLTTFICRLS